MAASTSRLTKLGRAADNDLVVTHPSVSAHHAELRFDSEQFLLRDLSSSNGTFVNGERITLAFLEEGDLIHLGPMLRQAAKPAATAVAHGDTARHRPVVEWAVQSTNNPTGDPRGPTYGSEGWGFDSLQAR